MDKSLKSLVTKADLKKKLKPKPSKFQKVPMNLESVAASLTKANS